MYRVKNIIFLTSHDCLWQCTARCYLRPTRTTTGGWQAAVMFVGCCSCGINVFFLLLYFVYKLSVWNTHTPSLPWMGHCNIPAYTAFLRFLVTYSRGDACTVTKCVSVCEPVYMCSAWRVTIYLDTLFFQAYERCSWFECRLGVHFKVSVFWVDANVEQNLSP